MDEATNLGVGQGFSGRSLQSRRDSSLFSGTSACSTDCTASDSGVGELHCFLYLCISGFFSFARDCVLVVYELQKELGRVSNQLLDMVESGSNGDLPSSGQVFTVVVAPGDVIIAGTDGLFDNLYNNEITATVVQAVRAGTYPQVTAQKIAALARQRAQDKNRQTPFSTATQDAVFRYYGGKLDEIVWSQDTHLTTKKTVACDTNEQQSDPISVPGHVRLNVAAPTIKMLFD
ncbi:hypothetical protein DY000_02024384 [Brassica cretica]|uniref:Protein phosphatase n=1 Tax=Brassica cretica TaxID=69181 RepID=A0ABQ7E951_BRACR|nr:hypothetical protein DY000_02024384 [Brassica cretica]